MQNRYQNYKCQYTDVDISQINIRQLYHDNPELIDILERLDKRIRANQQSEAEIYEQTDIAEHIDYNEVFSDFSFYQNEVRTDQPEQQLKELNELDKQFKQLENDSTAPDSTKRHKPKSFFSKLFSFVKVFLLLVVTLFLVISIANVYLVDHPEKSLLGYRFYPEKSNEMKSNRSQVKGDFSKGSLLIIKVVEPRAIQQDDVIVYATNDNKKEFQIRYVADIRGEGEKGIFFDVKKYADNSAVEIVNGNQLIGKKIISIPFVGVIFSFFHNFFLFCILGLFIILLLYFLRKIYRKR